MPKHMTKYRFWAMIARNISAPCWRLILNPFDDMPSGKAALRDKMRERLAEISPQQRAERSRRILDRLMTEGAWVEGAKVVALFGGIKTEPDLMPLVRWLSDRGRQAAFFAVGKAGLMEAYLVRDMDGLVTGPFGVLMPDVSKCPRVDDRDLSVVLAPGLAFSVRDGARLGRGKGYYDRVLTRLSPGARVIGIGFSVQMIESVPREPHDVCMESLVSEDEWRTIFPPA